MGFQIAGMSDFGPDDIKGKPPTEMTHVFITGLPGRGKTHLAHAIANRWGFNFMYVKAQDITKHDQEVMASAKVLILDDIGSEGDWDSYRAKIVNVLAQREENMKPTLVTSNLNLNEIAGIDARISSRLSGFKIIECVGKDRRRGKQGVIPQAPTTHVKQEPHFAQDLGVKWWMKLSEVKRREYFKAFACPSHRAAPEKIFTCPRGVVELVANDHVVRYIFEQYEKSLKRDKGPQEGDMF